MKQGFMCVAGVDTKTGKHVRPVLPRASLPTQLLARHGGPFDIATVVVLRNVRSAAAPPETEDHLFNPEDIQVLRTMGEKEFWMLLVGLARPKLRELFGPDLMPRDPNSCVVHVGKGCASLGCFIPSRRPHLYVRKKSGKRAARMALNDGEFDLDLSVTDIRLYGADHATVDERAVARTSGRLWSNRGVVLSVGLTRPYSGSSAEPVHWLQVNNIHLKGSPVWQLG
jgi:hypothetical protein